MVDLRRKPTYDEMNGIFKMGRRDAAGKARKLGAGAVPVFGGPEPAQDGGAFHSPYADEVGQGFQSGKDGVLDDLESSLCALNALHARAAGRAGALGDSSKLLDAASGSGDYQGDYRAGIRKGRMGRERAKLEDDAFSAEMKAAQEIAAAKRSIRELQDHALAWMRPYVEGLCAADPSFAGLVPRMNAPFYASRASIAQEVGERVGAAAGMCGASASIPMLAAARDGVGPMAPGMQGAAAGSGAPTERLDAGAAS